MKKILLFGMLLSCLVVSAEQITIRFNPWTVIGVENVYLSVWTESSGSYLVSREVMKMEPDGWLTHTFENNTNEAFYVSFLDSNNRFFGSCSQSFSNSCCFEYSYSSYSLQVVEYRKFEKENITIRLNPSTVDWANAYVYVWPSGYYNYNSSYAVVDAQKMSMAEDGWWTYSFDFFSDVPFCVDFTHYQVDKIVFYNSHPSYTGSACFKYVDNELQPTTYEDISPSADNSFFVHITTPGTLGLVLVQAIGTKKWSDVKALSVTGSLNEEDMKYFGRMMNLQILDLAGTDITGINGCKSLNNLLSVSLPPTCTIVNDSAFCGCQRLESINLSNIEKIEGWAFDRCVNLSTLTMPNVISVGPCAFYGCRNISTMEIPIVQWISSYAFADNVELSSISMPLVNFVGNYAFMNCFALSQVDLSNVTSLEEGAFYMETISDSSKLSYVYLSDELEMIPDKCFDGCLNLKSIQFPSALKYIGNHALPYITDVHLPQGLQSVGEWNFLYATSITIPASVISWGSLSSSWTDVYCHVVAPRSWSAFNDKSVANMTLHVPSISLAAYKLHNSWYQFGNIFPLESEVSEITIGNQFMLLTTDGISDKANMTLTSGAALSVETSNSLTLNKYEQFVGSSDWSYNYSGYSPNQIYYKELPYTGMLLANSPMTADAVSIKLFPLFGMWNFFSLPFDVNIADISVSIEDTALKGSTVQWVIREYSGANRASGNGETWNNVPANGVLQAHKGYILYCEVVEWWNYYGLSYFNMPAANNANKQNIFATGDVNVPLTEYSAEFPQNRSWNLIGNPYPCSFDIQQMDFEAPITTWNGNGYTAYSPLDDNYLLRPAEGFFVQAPQGATAITFHKEGRSAVNKQEVTQEEYYNGYYYAPRRAQANNVSRKVFNFTLSNADYSDRARLVLNENASADYELNRDAAKMLSTDKTVPQLYLSDSGIRYAINERPEGNGVFYMSAFFGKSGEYSIQLQSDDVQSTSIILTDTQTNVATDLTEGGYTFSTEGGTFDNRFVVSFIAKMPTGIGQVPSGQVQSTKKLRDGQLIIIRNGIEYNVNGQMTK